MGVHDMDPDDPLLDDFARDENGTGGLTFERGNGCLSDLAFRVGRRANIQTQIVPDAGAPDDRPESRDKKQRKQIGRRSRTPPPLCGMMMFILRVSGGMGSIVCENL